ncbi:hypothetical protein ABSA28_00551 [Candidatus Hepatincolaceae symbiont of Richtersius coronifer]
MDLSLFEAFIYTTITPKFDSLLDIIKIEILEEEYSGSSSITQYAMPIGLNSDFVKNNPLKIRIVDCCIKDSLGLSKGNLEVNMFKILELQQKLVPIFLKTSSYNGPVLMESWQIKRLGLQSLFSANFITTNIVKPYEEIEAIGTSYLEGLNISPASIPSLAPNIH